MRKTGNNRRYGRRASRRRCAGVVSRTLALFIAATASGAQAGDTLPKGPMINLDFERIENGLIPSKTLFPLYVPIGELGTKTSNDRTLLFLDKGQGLDIPHSSMLDPDGSAWVAIIRVFAVTDGMVMSQGNDEKGYAIYIKDGAVQAAIPLKGKDCRIRIGEHKTLPAPLSRSKTATLAGFTGAISSLKILRQ